MIYRSADPVEDFLRYDADCKERAKKFPICECCGDRITDEKFYQVVYRAKILSFCENCVMPQYTSDYIRDKEVMQF